jgi:exosome complex component RRP4
LIKRQKTHFHNLPCGASIILGNNGFVWLYPTPGHQDEEAGGYYTSLEVRAAWGYTALSGNTMDPTSM